eukprot:gb/GEZJ01008363.1/.p1 GENE.gb/GEZJ01008363.1/~~gb/GEZJ01008363.1/.p1  ORF type:complete len:147 (-),score=3.81 gb/GEZJ01008363.1/:31-471(-)
MGTLRHTMGPSELAETLGLCSRQSTMDVAQHKYRQIGGTFLSTAKGRRAACSACLFNLPNHATTKKKSPPRRSGLISGSILQTRLLRYAMDGSQSAGEPASKNKVLLWFRTLSSAQKAARVCLSPLVSILFACCVRRRYIKAQRAS